MRAPVTYDQIAKALKINPLKRYGQNFLLDESVTQRMASSGNVRNCHVVEVGSGPGTLARSILLERCLELDCVEVDKRLIPFLQSLSSSTSTPVRVHLKDIFKFDFCEAFRDVQPVSWNDESLPKARIIGNLPFNISIGLLLQFLKAVSERKGPFQLGRIPMYLTFQKEVAENIVCTTTWETNRLTIMAQAFCETKNLQFIHKTHFTPIPKVDAIFVQLIPRVVPKVNVSFDILEQVVKGAFSCRSKHISNSLKFFLGSNDELSKKILQYSDIEPTLHTYMLGMDDWSRLCDGYVKVMEEYELPLILQPMRSPPPIIHNKI